MNGPELKRLSPDAIPRSLERVERYRLLKQPEVAQSICQDILAVDPENQAAITGLVLALTDQFDRHQGPAIQEVLELIPGLKDEYDRVYYSGLIHERQARARLGREYPGAKFDAHELLVQAMEWYDRADKLASTGNEDARLHWNTCVRVIDSNNLRPRPTDDTEPAFD